MPRRTREPGARAKPQTYLAARLSPSHYRCDDGGTSPFARKYSSRAYEEWTPLFYRILQNGVRDWHRRQSVKKRVIAWFGNPGDEEPDVIAAAPDTAGRTPQEHLESREAMLGLERALAELPQRQKEAFMLRTFEGLDVAGTAAAMGCSTGSVKTHYSRAVHTLREMLGDHW